MKLNFIFIRTQAEYTSFCILMLNTDNGPYSFLCCEINLCNKAIKLGISFVLCFLQRLYFSSMHCIKRYLERVNKFARAQLSAENM